MNDHPDLKWIIFIVIGLWLLWVFSGGYNNYNKANGPFMKPPTPLDTGETYPNQ